MSNGKKAANGSVRVSDVGDLLKRLERNNFVVIGRAGVDIYPDPPGTRIEDAKRFVTDLGGSSANIAVGIIKLGGRASLVTAVSDDAIGRLARNRLSHYKVDTRHVRSVGGEARNSFAIAESRIEDHQSVIYRNGAADFEMNDGDISAVDYSAYGGLITTGTVLARNPSRDATFKAFELARKDGLPVIFDIDYRPYTWTSMQEAASVYERAAGYSDVIVGNDDEFGVMAGGKEKGLAFAENLAGSGAAIVVYKMGEFGSITFSPGRSFQTGIFPVNALKPFGAGDAFMGGLVAGLAQRMPLADCVRQGSASAAIVVGRIGCAPAMPDRDDLETFISTHRITESEEGNFHAHSSI